MLKFIHFILKFFFIVTESEIVEESRNITAIIINVYRHK